MKMYKIAKRFLKKLKHTTLLMTVALTACLLLLSSLTSCKSTPKTESYNNPTSRNIGPVNNPNYFGKGGETQEIVVEGRAQVMESGDQVAFDSAVQHAMREAVERVLGTMIDARTKVENALLISDKIYSRSWGFVQRYEILNERKEGRTLFVKLKAWVVLGDVRSDAMALGILQDRANRPIILVLIDEKDFSGNATHNAQRKIEETLLAKQFEFVDQEQLKKVLDRKRRTVEQILGSKDDMFDTALDAGAQVVIRGKVNKEVNDVSKNKLLKDKNLKSVRTTLDLKAFTAGDARLMAAKLKERSGIGLSEDAAYQSAAAKLGEKAAKEILDEFIKKWDDRVNSGFEYSVTITGLNFDDVVEIKNKIQRNIEGIKAVFDRGFSGQTLTLLVRYTGESSRLAQALTSKRKLPVPVKLKTYDSKSIILYK